MPDTTTKPRPYRSYDHLADVIRDERGAIHVQPLRATNVHFDIAHANHLPANLPDSRNGSHVLDIGRGVQVRASGNVQRDMDGDWCTAYLYASQYPSGRDLTAQQTARTREIIAEMVGAWAATHASDIAQADEIDRNNGARTLEENIARHEKALAILRAQLRACEEGERFTQYPDLPTSRR